MLSSLVVFASLTTAAAPPAPAAKKPAAAVFERLWPTGASASSTLSDDSESHDPRFAFDDDIRTVWVEGKPDEGKGESLAASVTPTKAKTLRLLIKNGLQASPSLLKQNAALARVDVRVVDEGGAESGKVSAPLTKKMGEQLVEVPLKSGVARIEMTIGDVVAGAKYKDTSITDVKILVDAPVDHKLQNKNRAALLQALQDVIRDRAVPGSFKVVDDAALSAPDLWKANAELIGSAGSSGGGDGTWFERKADAQPPKGLPEIPWMPLLKGSLTTYRPDDHQRGPSNCACCDAHDPNDKDWVPTSWAQSEGYWLAKTAKGQRVTTSRTSHIEGMSDEGDGDDNAGEILDFDGGGRLVAAASVSKHTGKMARADTSLALFTWKDGRITDVVVVTQSSMLGEDAPPAAQHYRAVP